MSYSVITPFLVPPGIAYRKRINIGDGFIFHSIKKLLSPLKCTAIFSSWERLSFSDISQINSTKVLILAGANQLHDDYSIVPGMTLRQLEDIKVPILPFGIGIYGHQHRNQYMSSKTVDILREIHRRIKFSSWRCPRTVNYIKRSLPELSDKALMTGCPVMYGNNFPISIDFPKNTNTNSVVVTVTDRGEFWERELSVLEFVAQHFKNSEKILSLHQNFFIPKWDLDLASIKSLVKFEIEKQYERTPLMLRIVAQKLGFKLFIPQTVEECWDLYKNMDFHMGSRLHAHLYFLSQEKASFLTYVDDRCLGFSEALDFPICETQNLEAYLDYDFSRCQSKISELNLVISHFTDSIKELCL